MISRWGVATLALLPLAALVCLSCSTDMEKRDEHLSDANAYLEEGKKKEAVFELRRALGFDPQNADIHYRIAEVLIDSGDAGGALFFFREAQRFDPTRTDAQIKEAGILFLEDPNAADALVDVVLAAEPSNAGAYVVRSKAALVRGDIDAGLRAARKAVELAPDDPLSHVQLGKVYQTRIRKGQIEKQPADDAAFEAALSAFGQAHQLNTETSAWLSLQHKAVVLSAWPGHAREAKRAHREAMQAAEEAGDDARRATIASSLTYGLRTGDLSFQAEMLEALVSLRPRDVDRWFQLAKVEEERGRASEEVLQRMLETLPNHAQAHLRYASHLIHAERLDEGLAHLESKANAGVEPPVLLSALVARLLDARRVEEAGKIVERLEREHPDDSNTALARASLQLDQGRTEEAALQLRVLVGRSQNPGAWQLLAQAEHRRGNLREALEAIANAIDLGQRLGRPFPERALRHKAHLQVASQDFSGALRSFHELQRHGAPLAIRDRRLRARALYRLGRRRAARRLLEAMMAETRSRPSAAIELAELTFAERPDEARSAIDRALEAQPSDPGLLLWAARFDLARGDPKRAVERVETAIAAKRATPALMLERARALTALGNVEQAERDALRAFELDPNLEGGVEVLLALFESEERDPRKVIESFEEADAVGALPPPARYLLARLQKRNGNRERARSLLEELVAADLGLAKNDLAYLLAEDGADLTRAQELAEEATGELRGRPQALHTLGYVLLRRGLHGSALEQLLLAQSSRSRSNPLVHYHTGMALQELGRLGEAEEAFALALDGGMAEAEQALRTVRAAKADSR